MIEYTLLKSFHIGALIFWLGPPLGAWLVLKYLEPLTNSPEAIYRAQRMFFFCLVVEHVALIGLLSSGWLLATRFGFWSSEWLQQKWYIILWLIIPLEAIDIVVGNGFAYRVTQKMAKGNPTTHWEDRLLHFYHGPFTAIAILIIPISVILILYLATGKVKISF